MLTCHGGFDVPRGHGRPPVVEQEEPSRAQCLNRVSLSIGGSHRSGLVRLVVGSSLQHGCGSRGVRATGRGFRQSLSLDRKAGLFEGGEF